MRHLYIILSLILLFSCADYVPVVPVEESKDIIWDFELDGDAGPWARSRYALVGNSLYMFLYQKSPADAPVIQQYDLDTKSVVYSSSSSFEQIYTLDTGDYTNVQMATSEALLLIGGSNGEALLYDLREHKAQVMAYFHSPLLVPGNRILAISAGDELVELQLPDGELRNSYSLPIDDYRDYRIERAMADLSRVLVSKASGSETELICWDLKLDTEIARYTFSKVGVISYHISPDLNYIWILTRSAGEERLQYYDLRTGAQVPGAFNTSAARLVYAFSESGDRICVQQSTAGGAGIAPVFIYNLATGERTYLDSGLSGSQLVHLSYCPDGKHIIGIYTNNSRFRARIWKI